MSIKKSHAKCSGCGGMLIYDAKSQNLVCKSCSSQTEINKIPNFSKNDYSETIVASSRKKTTCNCSNCGASLEVEEREITKKCPYCESNFVVENQDINGLIPDLIIPFQFNKESAIQKYKSGVKKKHFLPNKFKKSPNLDNISGTYLPSFSFDTVTDSIYNGRLTESHTRRRPDGRTETYYTSRNISGTRHYNFTNFIVEASSQTDQATMETIKPFNIDETSTYKYDADFLRGYSVESYDNDLHSCKILSENLIKERIKRMILASYSYDRVDYFNLTTTFSDYKYAYILVPVYFINFKYKQKDYTAVLNGQTGTLGGKLPKSGWKIAFTIIIPILIIASIILLVNLIS